MQDQRVNISERRRGETQFERLHKPKCFRLIRAGNLKRQHSAKAARAKKLLRQFVLRMSRQTRIVDSRDLRVMREPFRDARRIRALLTHPQWQCLDAAQCQPCLKRTQHSSDQLVQFVQRAPIFIRGHHDTRHHVAMSADVLGRAVHHIVNPVSNRIAQVRRGKRIVNQTLRAIAMR